MKIVFGNIEQINIMRYIYIEKNLSSESLTGCGMYHFKLVEYCNAIEMIMFDIIDESSEY